MSKRKKATSRPARRPASEAGVIRVPTFWGTREGAAALSRIRKAQAERERNMSPYQLAVMREVERRLDESIISGSRQP